MEDQSRENFRFSCLERLKKICLDKVDKLFGIWETVGHPNLTERAEVVCSSVQQLLSDMLDEETEYEQNLAVKIEELLKEAAELCKEVGGNYEEITNGLEDSGIPLLQIERLLNERLQNVRKCREERVNRYEQLLNKEHLLCLSMGLKKKPKISRVPQEQDIEELEALVTQLANEEKELKLQLIETSKKIESITSELGMSPETSFHKMLTQGSNLCLSSQNMRLLKELHQTMEQKLERAKSDSIELREKLSNLWERLHVGYEEREIFLMQYPGYSKRSLDALRNEIKMCEEKKRQNIRIFVETIREEVNEWWDKCCFGKSQRLQFRSYYSDCFTEDLLELHEIEVEKLRKYFNENIDILHLAKKREKLWKQMMELDERAHDPKRLFANRGGQLLKEEKERKAIQKDLPIIEKELNYLLDAYEEKHKTPFLYEGDNLREEIRSKWDVFQRKKEEEKLARKKGKDFSAEKTLSATKRKLTRSNTPLPVPNKITRTTPASSTKTLSVKKSEAAGSKVVRSIFSQLKSKSPRVPRGVQSPDSTYSDFQENLNKHSADQQMIRSSVVPSRLLRERNGRDEATTSSTKDRVATPVKPPRKNSTTRSCTNLSEFRTPQAPIRNHSPGLSRSRSAPRLAAVRGRLPIII